MFCKMCEFGYCSINGMKPGILVSILFKGGNEDKRNPNSHQAISLCSTVLSLWQEMSLQKTNGVGLKKEKKYNTRLSTCT